MVTYVDAASAPLKNTGQIRLYGPDDFEGMRKACQLTARCLDELAGMVRPGLQTEEIDRFCRISAYRSEVDVRCMFRRITAIGELLRDPCTRRR